MDDNLTMKFDISLEKENKVRKILEEVSKALEDKGYNANNQLIGYILSGDPTYITSHNNARGLITQIDRDEILEELLNYYN